MLGDVYSQKVLDTCNVTIVPLLASKQQGVKVSAMSHIADQGNAHIAMIDH